MVTNELVTSKLDYCNVSLRMVEGHPLEQNAANRLLTGTREISRLIRCTLFKNVSSFVGSCPEKELVCSPFLCKQDPAGSA